MRDRLLIVDDEVGVRKQIAWGLRERFDIAEAADSDGALERFGALQPSVVTLDVRLTGPTCRAGIGLLREMLVEDPTVKIIMVTADTDDTNATRALELGAWDYHTKPIAITALLEAATRAARVRRLQAVSKHRSDLLVSAVDFHAWLGESETACRVGRLLETLATTDELVLISGEPGTGRELSARAIHELGPRRGEPFVELDCGVSLPDPVSLPDRATIFLDEVTALGPSDAESLPEWIGAVAPDRRVIAASPTDLAAKVTLGSFPERSASYLSRLTATLPALREHQEDIPGIVLSLLAQIATRFGARATALAPDAERALVRHRWPGNFRELEKRVLGAALVTDADVLRETDLWPGLLTATPTGLKAGMAEFERSLIEQAMIRNHGNVSRAARELGISRPSLHSHLRKHEMDAGHYRKNGES